MEVLVVYRDKKYSYVKLGDMMTWVDEERAVVPVMLHSMLREKAIASGTNSEVFLSTIEEMKAQKEKNKEEKKISKIKKKITKKNVLTGFKIFKKENE